MTSSPFHPLVLEGRHVRLEPLAPAHVDALLAAASGPRDTYRWTFVPDTRAEMAAYVARALELQTQGAALPFATVRREDGRVVGSTRFMSVERWTRGLTDPPPATDALPQAVEIGATWLAAEAQRTAINTEAKWLMLSHAFEAWGVFRVSLKTDARNERSRAAIGRLGAVLEGVSRAHMFGSDGAVRDTACFSILLAEWPAVRARLDAQRARAMVPG